jgi:hypothetical protein
MGIVILIFWGVLAALTSIGGQTRLMLLGLPFAAVLCGLAYYSLENMPRRPIDIVFIMQAAMIVSVFLGMFDYIHFFANTRVLEYHAEVISEDRYLSHNMGALYDAMLELDNLPDESRVLFLWEPKTYYCPETLSCNGDLLFDNWSRPLQNGLTPEDLIAQWQDEYDYMLLFDYNEDRVDGFSLWSEFQTFALEENALFPQHFYDSVTEVWSDGFAYTIYTWE